MSELEPRVTVSRIERLTNERRTTAGVAHDIHVALTGPLHVAHAEQRLGADWRHQSSWPLSFERAEWTDAPEVVLGWVPDDRQDEAVEAFREALDRLQRP